MIAPRIKAHLLAARTAAGMSGSSRLLRLCWRRLLPKWWRQRGADQAAMAPATTDRIREMMALGAAMAEAEAIWQLRQKAMRSVADHIERPVRQAARDAEIGSS